MTAVPAGPRSITFRMALGISGASGFMALSYELLWYRGISFVSGSSPAAFGLLLGYYLLGLALGAYLSRRWCTKPDRRRSAGNRLQLSYFVAYASLLGFLVLPAMAWLSERVIWLVGLPLVTCSAAMFGAILPLLSHHAIAPEEQVGAKLSQLYLANIVGSAAGTLLTGFVFLELWSLRTVSLFLLCMGSLLAAAMLVASRAARRVVITRMLLVAAASLVCLASAPSLFDGFYERLLYKTKYTPDRTFARILENRAGVVAITHDRGIYGGGAYDGVVSTDLMHDRNTIVRAYAVAAFRPAVREILVVGLSMGAWVEVLSQIPGVERITVVEINPGYLDLIRQYPEVRGILTNPRIDIVIDDGRRWLTRHPSRRFDLIVQNTTFHWRAHTTNLLSQEYCEMVGRHLNPGGVYYFNTTDSEEALKTAFTVFPHGFRLKNFAAASDSALEFDTQRFRRALQEYRIDGHAALDASTSAGRRRLDEVIADLERDTGQPRQNALEKRSSIMGRLGATGTITDDNMLSEWRQIILVPPWTPF